MSEERPSKLERLRMLLCVLIVDTRFEICKGFILWDVRCSQ